MATIRTSLITAIVTALGGVGKPTGLTVGRRPIFSIEDAQLPATRVSRVKEDVNGAVRGATRSPVVDRRLMVQLDHYVQHKTDPEEALEPLLAWATKALLTDPGLGGYAIEITEESTEWDTDPAEEAIGHASQVFAVRFITKRQDQEVKQ